MFGQHTLINEYLAQIVSWIESDQLRVAEVTVFDMDQLPEAHRLIQSGMSVGKIVVRCGADDDSETDEKGERKGRGGQKSEERRGQQIDETRGDTRGGKDDEEGEGLTAAATAAPVRSESNTKKKQKKKAKKN